MAGCSSQSIAAVTEMLAGDLEEVGVEAGRRVRD